MQTDILIIGGGISGLAATWQLRSAGINASLMEARPRFGGRILTLGDNAHCDLGPSWFWPGQPLIASLLKHFTIPFYQQFSQGAVLFQQADGQVETSGGPSPMAGMLRIEGGINVLTDVIADEIDLSHRFLEHEITGLSINKDIITVDATTPSGNVQVQANKVALAIPPRLAANLTFSPALPAKTLQTLAGTPTWMAAHAKFFAVYDKPFWREKGLSGTAISQHGPLSEIHDASPNAGNAGNSVNAGYEYSLFGFSGIDANTRRSIPQADFIKLALAQLVRLFGEDAGQPKTVYFQDWSTEKFTATTADLKSPSYHPEYGLSLQLGSEWEGKLEFISTETSFGHGGLIEGALEAGLGFSQSITGQSISGDRIFLRRKLLTTHSKYKPGLALTLLDSSAKPLHHRHL